MSHFNTVLEEIPALELVRRKHRLRRMPLTPRSYPDGYNFTRIGPAKRPIRS